MFWQERKNAERDKIIASFRELGPKREPAADLADKGLGIRNPRTTVVMNWNT